MTEIIFHHYPQSPFSEKVRLAFGLKGLSWRSVHIPVIMPKPDLVPLTGGYRRTPVMQIGADIFCDTQCILRELERRFPEPTLYPGASQGLAHAVSAWADRQVFPVAAAVVFAIAGEKFPEPFRLDRAKFSGRDFSPEKMKAALPHLRDQLRAHLSGLEAGLADGRDYLLGAAAGHTDFAIYHPIWFLRRNVGAEGALLPGFPRVSAWFERVGAIGHGQPSEMSSKDALALARSAQPQTTEATDAGDPNGRRPGEQVSVTPDDTGRDPVSGELVASSADEIVIRRSDPQVGEVMVHFPRAGFVVAPA